MLEDGGEHGVGGMRREGGGKERGVRTWKLCKCSGGRGLPFLRSGDGWRVEGDAFGDGMG